MPGPMLEIRLLKAAIDGHAPASERLGAQSAPQRGSAKTIKPLNERRPLRAKVRSGGADGCVDAFIVAH